MQPADKDLFGEPLRDLEQSQLFTPLWLAARMARWVPRTARVLEPSCGTGNLIDALVCDGHEFGRIQGIERDPRMVDFALKRLGNPCSSAVLCGDFFLVSEAFTPNWFDVVLMNPPYEDNEHLRFVLRALELAREIVGLFPADFEFTQFRDSQLWATRGVVRQRAFLPERVKFAGAGGQNEHVVLRIARRTQARRLGEQRQVFEETWRPGDAA